MVSQGFPISFMSFLKGDVQLLDAKFEKFPKPWSYHSALSSHIPHLPLWVSLWTLGHVHLKVSSAAWLVTPCFNMRPFDLLALCMYLSLVPFVDSGKAFQFFIAILNFNPGPQYAHNPPGLVWWVDFISILYSIIQVTNENIKLKQAPNRPWVTLLKMNFQFDDKPW